MPHVTSKKGTDLEQRFAGLVHHFDPLLHHRNVIVRVRAEHLHEVLVTDAGIVVGICDGDSFLCNHDDGITSNF